MTSTVGSAALRKQLGAALTAERAGQAFGETSRILKKAIAGSRADLLSRRLPGDEFAARFAQSIHSLLVTLFEAQPDDVRKAFALCAVGGYGRGELAPFSDIDLLFLSFTDDDEVLRASLDALLYPLWDAGLKVGHSVHSPKSAINFAKADIIGRTAFLDARFLCGERVAFDKFITLFDGLRRRTGAAFVDAKLEEQAERQLKSDETRYLVEPDIKDGKGGLRDLQTIEWIYKYVYGERIGASKAIARVLDDDEIRALRKAHSYLWSVRVEIHDIRGEADDRLTFDIQPEIARRLNYADRRDISATERLMRHYFVNTIEVGRLTRILCAKLEEENSKKRTRLPKGLPKYLQSDEAPGKPNIRLNSGRLDFQSAARAVKNPRDFFRYFRAFSKSETLDFHPNALAVISANLPLVTKEVRHDEHVSALFAGILTRSKRGVRALRVMIEVGLLGKYIPAIGELMGRIDYGLYRRFTIDEHVLRCLLLLDELRRGEWRDMHPISTDIVRSAKDPLRFYLGVLLHEVIWTVKDRSEAASERLIKRICKRMDLPDSEGDLIAWCATHHQLLARTAERRNLADVQSILSFAHHVKTRERLNLLTVLTICHLRIVGMHSWDEVTRRQITELYEATATWFDGGDEALAQRIEAREQEARQLTRTRLADWPESDKDAFLTRLNDSVLRSIDADIVVRFAHLVRAAEQDKANSAVTITPRDGDLEAIVYADDRPGLLADLAGQAAQCGLSVRTVQALTTVDGKAIDIFVLQSPDGAAIDDLSTARRLHEYLMKAASGVAPKAGGFRRRFGDRRQIFNVTPSVVIDQRGSENATIIETEGLDRPGLLFDLTSALSSLGVTIASAHVATYGERAVDAFYLQTVDGAKITDNKVLARIENRLMKVLSGDPRQ